MAKIKKKNQEQEAEIERLQEMIRVSDKMIYHPIKDDPIDRKLGEYINSAPMRIRLQIMRLERENEGVYRYGMKRAFIKIENDMIIVRVGGGFMNIDEFVDQHCWASSMNETVA